MAHASQASEKRMLVGSDRIFYAGLHGRPVKRKLGGVGFIAALEGTISIIYADGQRDTAAACVISPYVEHSLECAHPHVTGVLIEPESVCPQAMSAFVKACRTNPEGLSKRLAEARRRFASIGGSAALTAEWFDQCVFDEVLPRRAMDPRIARVVERLCRDPAGAISAEQCAAIAALSVSRFLHLFKEETGASLRALRAWKRARHMLNFANENVNMAHLALDIGYPDSTHFSHSIRRFYGLNPRAIFAGSRDLEIFGAHIAAE